MYTVITAVLIAAIIGHSQAVDRVRDPSTIPNHPIQVITDLSDFRYVDITTSENGKAVVAGNSGLEVFNSKGIKLNDIRGFEPLGVFAPEQQLFTTAFVDKCFTSAG